MDSRKTITMFAASSSDCKAEAVADLSGGALRMRLDANNRKKMRLKPNS